jgi:hypothetical protein
MEEALSRSVPIAGSSLKRKFAMDRMFATFPRWAHASLASKAVIGPEHASRPILSAFVAASDVNPGDGL